MSRESFIEPRLTKELSSEEETEEKEPRDNQQVTEHSEEHQNSVFVSPAVFTKRKEYVSNI